MNLRTVDPVDPGDQLSAAGYNTLAANADTLSDRAALPAPGSRRFRTARTSDGDLADGDRLAWPDEPIEQHGITRLDDDEGVRLDEPGIYYAIAQIAVLGRMNHGSRFTAVIAEHSSRDYQYGTNSYRLPNGWPMVQASAMVLVTNPVELAVWYSTDSSETMPIYTDVHRTSLTVARLSPWQGG